jgi:hypothetical protein
MWHSSVTESVVLPPDLASGTMAEYRVYLIDSDDRFYDVVPLICADDDEAMEKAKHLAGGHDVELWQRDRKVARFDHKPKMQF